jgi:hypothetical protein
MKKVFVLICEGVYDYEGGTDVYLFSNYKDAKELFNSCRDDAVKVWVTNGYWVVDDDSENTFCVCEEGDYTRNRFAMRIEEKEIK